MRALLPGMTIAGYTADGDPGADQPLAVAACARRRVAIGPPEPLGAGLEALDEPAVRPRVAGLRVDVGFVADAQFDRVDVAGDGEFVHRDLEGEHAGALTGRTHPERHGHIEFREPVTGLAGGGGVQHARRDRGLLGVLLDGGGLLDDLVADGGERAVALGAEPDVLDGRGAVADDGEHLLTGERQLDGSTGDTLRGHDGEHVV